MGKRIIESEKERWAKINKELMKEVVIDKDTICVEDFEGLKDIKSETHYIESLKANAAFVYTKDPDDFDLCLSSHTFYESNYVQSTINLQKRGFNVVLKSWG